MAKVKAQSKDTKSAKYAEFLSGLTPAAVEHVVSPTVVKEIADALEKVGDALPADRLAAVLDIVMAHQPRAVYEALARRPLPHLEPLLAPRLAARKQKDDFAATFFLAALEAGVLQPAAAWARVLERTVNMPGVVKQAPKVETAPAVLAVGRQVLASYVPDTPELCQPFQLVYGLVGALAKEGSQASIDAIAAFTERAAATNESAERQTLRLLQAVGKGEPAASLASRLGGSEDKRREGASSQALARRLALPMRDEKDWSASIWIGVGPPTEWFGLMQRTALIHLNLRPAFVPDWYVELRDTTPDHIFDCRGGQIFRDDFGLAPLATLDAFPRWIVDAGKKLQVVFTPAEAAVNCGRQRSAADLIRAWLGGGE